MMVDDGTEMSYHQATGRGRNSAAVQTLVYPSQAAAPQRRITVSLNWRSIKHSIPATLVSPFAGGDRNRAHGRQRPRRCLYGAGNRQNVGRGIAASQS